MLTAFPLPKPRLRHSNIGRPPKALATSPHRPFQPITVREPPIKTLHEPKNKDEGEQQANKDTSNQKNTSKNLFIRKPNPETFFYFYFKKKNQKSRKFKTISKTLGEDFRKSKARFGFKWTKEVGEVFFGDFLKFF